MSSTHPKRASHPGRLKNLLTALAVLIATLLTPALTSTTAGAYPATPPQMSYTRLLRRVILTLEGRSPTDAEYQAILNAPSDAARDALIDAQIEDSLVTPAFYEEVLNWGMEMLRVGRFDHFSGDGEYTGSQAIWLEYCPGGTVHEYKLGILLVPPNPSCTTNIDACYMADGDHPEICNNPNAPTTTVEPWWAPGTQVQVVGTATNAATQVPDVENSTDDPMLDCGQARILQRNVYTKYNPTTPGAARCGCGPNLIYCARRSHALGLAGSGPPGNPRKYDAHPNDPTGQRRAVFEEPARLFAHLVETNADLSDLVLGDYTVVNQGLQHMYVRQGRMNGDNAAVLDASNWWQQIIEPDAWRKVTVETMNPNLLADRDYTYDPTTAVGPPIGVPSAGILTSIGWMGSFERERPRAARALEVLACRQFNPPPADAIFPPLNPDPAEGGVCKHCHTTLDPAAIHFKRWEPGALKIGGIGPWTLAMSSPELLDYSSTVIRWNGSFRPNTWLTPITEADKLANADAVFIDFLPPQYKLFGETSDGTIGPLGFAKMIVKSGVFDKCMVRRFYKRFGGVELDQGTDALYIQKLVNGFTASGRNSRELIRTIVKESAFRLGK